MKLFTINPYSQIGGLSTAKTISDLCKGVFFPGLPMGHCQIRCEDDSADLCEELIKEEKLQFIARSDV
jgi:hypothetical protein